jgi:subtilisin family serine protease
MPRKYAILRGKRRLTPTSGLEAAPGPAPASAVDPTKAKVDVADLSPRDAREITREDDVAVVAPVMPTVLIRPLEAPSAAAGPSWGISAVGADTSQFDGTGVTVAVLDTGIDAQHAAFQGVTLTQEDFSGSGNGDRQGHGTHCAGTVFGRDVAGTRIGVARGVTQALIGKVLGDDGSGSSDALFQAMNWALQKGARVISMSLGFDFPGMVERLVGQGWPADLAASVALEAYRANLRMFDEIMRMTEARIPFDGGAVVVAAAGNESRRNVQADYEIAVSIPAAAAGVVSVAALEQGQQGLGIAYFSNTNAEISGPGVSITSARAGGGLVPLSGTSMAAPHVAGVTALWWQAIRERGIPATARNVAAQLLANAKTNPLAPNIDIADRGVGLVMAP